MLACGIKCEGGDFRLGMHMPKLAIPFAKSKEFQIPAHGERAAFASCETSSN